VQGHQNLWKPPNCGLWKLPRYRSSEGRTIADAARELEIGTEPFCKSVRQDEDDRGERDDRLISKDAEELKRLRKGRTRS
jgi:transposase